MRTPRRAHRVLAGAGAALLALAALVLVLVGERADRLERDDVAIMPLGDSITDGYDVPGGYRIELEDALLADGVAFDFVGSLTNGPPELADRDYEGHDGWQIDQLRAAVADWVSTHGPDVVLALIGTNDIAHDVDVANAPSRLGALIDRIHAVRPSTHVIVASIPPIASGADEAEARAYNAAVAALVSARAQQGRAVSFADVHAALTKDDLVDGLHPTKGGYAKIAEVWRDALRPVLPRDR